MGKSLNPRPSLGRMSQLLRRGRTSDTEGMTLLRLVFEAERGNILLYLAQTVVGSVLALTSPVITRWMIQYVEEGGRDLLDGVGLVGLCLIQLLVTNILSIQNSFRILLTGFFLSNGVTALVAETALRYPSLDHKEYSSSDMNTLVSIDGNRFNMVTYYLSSIIFLPIQILIGIYLMYSAVGVAFTGGLLMIGLINVYTYFLSKIIKRNNE